MTAENPPKRKVWRWVCAGVLAVLAVVLAAMLWPAPNGHDDLIRAGTMVHDRTTDVKKLSEVELRQVVATNAEALRLMRVGLGRECRAPVEYSEAGFQKLFPGMSGCQKLAQALYVEAKVAELDQRNGDAMRSCLDAIQLGHEAARGGLVVHHMVGIGVEGLGAQGLSEVVADLNARECREAIARLEALEAKREPSAETLRIERQWVRSVESFGHRMAQRLAMRSFDPTKKFFTISYLPSLQRTMGRQGTILTDLAKRAYELEKGRPPATPGELVPAYLKALPGSSNAVNSATPPGRANR